MISNWNETVEAQKKSMQKLQMVRLAALGEKKIHKTKETTLVQVKFEYMPMLREAITNPAC